MARDWATIAPFIRGRTPCFLLEMWTMDRSVKVVAFLSDDRLLANLIAVHVVLAGLLITSLIVRRILQSGGQNVLAWFGVSWLRGVTVEATSTIRDLVYWTTTALMAASVVGAVLYHLAGRDVRVDGVALWNQHYTAEDAALLG